MKLVKNGADKFIIGTTREIKSTYKSIKKASIKCQTGLYPTFQNCKFSFDKKMYALHIGFNNEVKVLSSDTMLFLLLGGRV